MNVVSTDNTKLYPAEAKIARDFALRAAEQAGLEIAAGETLRFVPDSRIILRATLAKREVVLRIPLSAKGLKPMTREWTELTRAHAYMSDGPYQVVQPVHFDPESGLTVISFVEGTPLMTYLRKLDKSLRATPYAEAGAWLQRYISPTLTERPANPRHWLQKAKSAMESQPHARLRDVEGRIFRQMRHLSKRIADHDWQVAITHGDFHPNNLILADDALIGIDTGGSAVAPVAKDLARSLTHMARRGLMFGKTRTFGMDAAAYEALSRKMDLPDVFWDTHLPFMLCFETLFRVEHPDMPENRVEHARDMATGLLRDLRQIT